METDGPRVLNRWTPGHDTVRQDDPGQLYDPGSCGAERQRVTTDGTTLGRMAAQVDLIQVRTFVPGTSVIHGITLVPGTSVLGNRVMAYNLHTLNVFRTGTSVCPFMT